MSEARRLREIETQAMARGDKNLAAEARAQMAREGIAAIIPQETLAPAQVPIPADPPVDPPADPPAPLDPPVEPETTVESTALETVTPPKAPKKKKK